MKDRSNCGLEQSLDWWFFIALNNGPTILSTLFLPVFITFSLIRPVSSIYMKVNWRERLHSLDFLCTNEIFSSFFLLVFNRYRYAQNDRNGIDAHFSFTVPSWVLLYLQLDLFANAILWRGKPLYFSTRVYTVYIDLFFSRKFKLKWKTIYDVR